MHDGKKNNPAQYEPDRLFGPRSYGPQLDWLICRNFTNNLIKQSIWRIRLQKWMNSVKVVHLVASAHCTFYCLRPTMRIAQGYDFSDFPWNNPLPSVFSFQRILPLIRKTNSLRILENGIRAVTPGGLVGEDFAAVWAAEAAQRHPVRYD